MPQIFEFKFLMKFCLEMCWTVFVSPSLGGVQKMSSFWFYRSDLRRKWWWDKMRGHPPPPVVRASHMCCGVRREPGRQAPLCPELRSPAISQSEASLGWQGPIRGEQRWPALACVASEPSFSPAAARVVILKRRTGNNSEGCFTNNNWSWTQQHMYKTARAHSLFLKTTYCRICCTNPNNISSLWNMISKQHLISTHSHHTKCTYIHISRLRIKNPYKIICIEVKCFFPFVVPSFSLTTKYLCLMSGFLTLHNLSVGQFEYLWWTR